MPFTSNGAYEPISIPAALVEVAESIKQEMGSGTDVPDITETSPLIQLAKASMIAPLERLSNDIGYLLSQAFLDGVTGINLDLFAEGFGQRRQSAARATGTVHVIFTSALSTPPEPDPWLPSGSITFISTTGRRYDLAEDVSVDGTSAVDIQVRDQQTGVNGNIAADSLSAAVIFNDISVAARWNSNVDSFTNPEAFVGGATTEADLPFKNRIRLARSSRESATVDGILFTLEQRNLGIESADVIENKTMTGGQGDIAAQQTGTGTASENINGSTVERIAFKVTPGVNRWCQHIGFVLDTDNNLVVDAAIHEDNGGEPGALLGTQFQVSGVDAAGASSLTVGTFSNALVSYYLDGTLPRDLWIVLTHVSGTGNVDGDNTGSAGDVLTYDGATWTNDSNINNANVRLIGGVPPKGIRVFALGGLDDDIAQAIFDSKAAGIEDDGAVSVEVKDRQGFAHYVNFERPVEVDLYAELTVKVRDSEFPTTGGEDLIKNLIVLYIGGTDLDGQTSDGLAVSEDFVMDQLIATIGDADNTDGFISIPVRKVDTVAVPVNTGDITPARGELFRIDPANIAVTIQRV